MQIGIKLQSNSQITVWVGLQKECKSVRRDKSGSNLFLSLPQIVFVVIGLTTMVWSGILKNLEMIANEIFWEFGRK